MFRTTPAQRSARPWGPWKIIEVGSDVSHPTTQWMGVSTLVERFSCLPDGLDHGGGWTVTLPPEIGQGIGRGAPVASRSPLATTAAAARVWRRTTPSVSVPGVSVLRVTSLLPRPGACRVLGDRTVRRSFRRPAHRWGIPRLPHSPASLCGLWSRWHLLTPARFMVGLRQPQISRIETGPPIRSLTPWCTGAGAQDTA